MPASIWCESTSSPGDADADTDIDGDDDCRESGESGTEWCDDADVGIDTGERRSWSSGFGTGSLHQS